MIVTIRNAELPEPQAEHLDEHRRSVLIACPAPGDLANGAGGTCLRIGEQLERRAWSVSYLFRPPRGGLLGRMQRQLTYVEVFRRTRAVRPEVAVVSSGDGALLRLMDPRQSLIVQSHGLEHMCREASERFGGFRESNFGAGHRWVREPAVAYVARAADLFVVKTDLEAEYASTRLSVDDSRIKVIPNGVEEAFFTIDRGQHTHPTVVWIGTWTDLKGWMDLPGILDRVVADVPEVRMHIIGGLVGEEGIRRTFPRRLWSNLQITDQTDREGILSACREADAGLFTSRYEGFGKVVVEVMAAGLPIVTTRVGVAPSVVVEGESGYFYQPGDAGTAGEALARLLTSEPIRLRLGSAARSSVENLRWSVIGEQWASAIEEALARRRHVRS